LQQLPQFPRGTHHGSGLAAGQSFAQSLHQAVFNLRDYLRSVHAGLL
jgi:hypothetical protein